MDEDFIRRGLARNEDEFYQCTESELSIFWHAPFYKTTEQIIEYGKNAGYTYIDLKTENLEQSDDNPFDVIRCYKLFSGTYPIFFYRYIKNLSILTEGF